jgi:hypothetical protein
MYTVQLLSCRQIRMNCVEKIVIWTAIRKNSSVNNNCFTELLGNTVAQISIFLYNLERMLTLHLAA